MFTATQLVCHAVGDYVLQTHHQVVNKGKSSLVCAIHALTYTLPFLLITTSWAALAVIASSHFVIDRWRLARYICWAKNQFAPASHRYRLETPSGYPADVPVWLSTWLLFITDNIVHIVCNALAIWYLG